jgi:hypothetical protein
MNKYLKPSFCAWENPVAAMVYLTEDCLVPEAVPEFNKWLLSSGYRVNSMGSDNRLLLISPSGQSVILEPRTFIVKCPGGAVLVYDEETWRGNFVTSEYLFGCDTPKSPETLKPQIVVTLKDGSRREYVIHDVSYNGYLIQETVVVVCGEFNDEGDKKNWYYLGSGPSD